MDYKVTMDSDLFKNLKIDMDAAIDMALREMEKVGSDEATVTAKISINKSAAVNGFTGETYDQPNFGHKVSFQVPVKGQMEGKVDGLYALGKDSDGAWMVYDMDGQTRMDI